MHPRVFVTFSVDVRKKWSGAPNRGFNFDTVDILDFLDGSHGADGNTRTVSDDERVLRIRMIERRKPSDRKLGDHVVAIGCVDFAVRAESAVVLTLADRYCRVVPFLDVHDIRVLV